MGCARAHLKGLLVSVVLFLPDSPTSHSPGGGGLVRTSRLGAEVRDAAFIGNAQHCSLQHPACTRTSVQQFQGGYVTQGGALHQTVSECS